MKKTVSALLVLLLFYRPLVAQRVDSTILTYASTYAPERAYLQYDKASYTPGETIWFKAYLLEGLFPSEGSKTFYVDWTDDKGNLLHHTVIPVQNSITHSQFD